jgi:hypothetical protein
LDIALNLGARRSSRQIATNNIHIAVRCDPTPAKRALVCVMMETVAKAVRRLLKEKI